MYTTVGKIAHVCAAESGGPRYNPDLSDEDTRSYPNLLLLCATHHDDVDADDKKYTVDVLRKIKLDHEDWVRTSLEEEMINVGYPELEVIISYLGTTGGQENPEEYSITKIKHKIEKNELTTSVEGLIRMGLTRAPTINAYLNDFPDPQYEDRLKKIFVEKYETFREDGLRGDDLFYALVEAVKGTNNDIKRIATAIALVTYFFERCDIFEK